MTGVKEPYFPEKARLSRMFTGSMVIIIMVSPWPDGKQFPLRFITDSVSLFFSHYCFFFLSAVRGHDILGDSHHLPQYSQRDDV